MANSLPGLPQKKPKLFQLPFKRSICVGTNTLDSFGTSGKEDTLQKGLPALLKSYTGILKEARKI